MLVDGFTVMPLMVLALGALLALTFGATLHQAAFARVSVRRLQREVQRRARLETELRRHQHNLEQLVAQRTGELEERNRELERAAGTDALTGVLNRGRFEEEFAFLMEETDLGSAMQVAERMRTTLGTTPIELPNGTRLDVTASFGLATCTAGTKGRKQLFKQADEALYEAKANGRNRVEGAGFTM